MSGVNLTAHSTKVNVLKLHMLTGANQQIAVKYPANTVIVTLFDYFLKFAPPLQLIGQSKGSVDTVDIFTTWSSG